MNAQRKRTRAHKQILLVKQPGTVENLQSVLGFSPNFLCEPVSNRAQAKARRKKTKQKQTMPILTFLPTAKNYSRLREHAFFSILKQRAKWRLQ